MNRSPMTGKGCFLYGRTYEMDSNQIAEMTK